MENLKKENQALKEENQSLKNEKAHWKHESAQKDRAIEALSMKIQELEQHIEQLRTEFEKSKSQSRTNVTFRQLEIITLLNQASNQKEEIICNLNATVTQLTDKKNELERYISGLTNELIIRDLRIECLSRDNHQLEDELATRNLRIEHLSRHTCEMNCATLTLLHILFIWGYKWCNHVLLKTALVGAILNGANISLDKDLYLCAKSLELFKKAKFVICFGEEEQIKNISGLLRSFKEKFPKLYAILEHSHPVKIGHAAAVEPPQDGSHSHCLPSGQYLYINPVLQDSRIYCPQNGRELEVQEIEGQGYSKVTLWLVNETVIKSVASNLSSMDPSGKLCCNCLSGASESRGLHPYFSATQTQAS